MLTNWTLNSVTLETQASATSSLANSIAGGAVYLMHSAGSTPGERGLRFWRSLRSDFLLCGMCRGWYVVACVGEEADGAE